MGNKILSNFRPPKSVCIENGAVEVVVWGKGGGGSGDWLGLWTQSLKLGDLSFNLQVT